ncbi:hypothetical protein CDV31_012928 [Fusarium ambrosium]|uniref:Uncharacterized protein n=1 Tax=Fusarium ambrosium TaxID=131363 RepID=A0A428T6K1_9HYPO|nr:hypothetical protein CDV31_012928 [Fusarium ambrosium]
MSDMLGSPQPSADMPPASIFTLPYELRYEIYKHYFTHDDGYVFQAGPGKLTTVDGKLIDLALIYTCRLIAEEANDLPLRFNTVSFSTVYHPEWSAWAGRFHYQLDLQASMRSDLLLSMVRQVTPDMYSQIALKFPRFVPMLKSKRGRPAPQAPFRYKCESKFNVGVYRCLSEGQKQWRSGRERTSMVNQAVAYTLRLIGQRQGQRVAAWVEEEAATHDILGFLDKAYEPWDIPSKSDLTSTGFELDDKRVWGRMNEWRKKGNGKRRYREKFRFSAAAVAIRFLNSLPIHKRLQLRKVVVHEDHVSVAHPQRHAQGLIPFCRENPRLRIERRVDVLNAIIQQTELSQLSSLPTSSRDDPNTRYHIRYSCITGAVADWLLEGLATVDAGMPADAFTLVLDSGRATDLCSDIFQLAVQHGIAWQTALERCHAIGIPWNTSQVIPEYTFTNAPQDLWQALEHLSNQTSVLRCNFHPGQPLDVEKIFNECSNWNIRKWQNCWSSANVHRDFDVLPPLPAWGDTLLENFEMEPERTRNKDRKRHRVGGRRLT